MKLLIEKRSEPVLAKAEGDSSEKKYFIEGIFLQSNLKNHNGRVYPKEILQKEVQRYIKERVEMNRATGELGHPSNPSINLDRISHKIEWLKEDGDNFIGKARILDTPYGKIVKNLIDEGVEFGVSSRGLGSVKQKNGVNIVCEDFYLVTPADIVSEPSAPDAFVTGLMENKEWAWDNGRLIEIESQVKNQINSAARNELNEEKLIELYNKILSSICYTK